VLALLWIAASATHPSLPPRAHAAEGAAPSFVLAQAGAPCETPGDCDDNDPCNGEEQCNLGFCALGTPPSCEDDNPCTDDFCQAGIGCRNEPNQASCSDGNPCNGEETCAGRTCRSGTPPNCADGNDCTLDTCDPELGCIHPPSTGPCEAGGCVTDGQCQDGRCVGQPLCNEECATCEVGECDSLCGRPSGAGEPSTTDALFILQAAVGARECALCICDVDGDGEITTVDALLILRVAVGEDLDLTCPAA
jgi:hypothetical protein